jgi:hypothetical protein
VQLALGPQLLNRAELPIREMLRPVGRGELDAIAARERTVYLSIERHTLKPPPIVGDARWCLGRQWIRASPCAGSRSTTVAPLGLTGSRIISSRSPAYLIGVAGTFTLRDEPGVTTDCATLPRPFPESMAQGTERPRVGVEGISISLKGRSIRSTRLIPLWSVAPDDMKPVFSLTILWPLHRVAVAPNDKESNIYGKNEQAI